MEDYELSPKYAQPNAKKILKEDFYWSFEENTGPFGSDNAYDIFHSFLEWREDHSNISPVNFIYDYIEDIGYPELDLKETNKAALLEYTDSYKAVDVELSEEMILKTKDTIKRKAEEEGEIFDEQRFMEVFTGARSSSGITFLADIDNLIITTGFGQFVVEGEVDEDLLGLTKIALQREFMPMLLNLYDKDDQKVRKEQLDNMLMKLEQMK